MADSSTPAIITGLAVGIALIVLLGSIFTPQKPFLLYRIMVEDTTFTIPYRFSDERQDRIVNMTIVPDGVILLHVVVPQGSLLEIRFPNELLNQLEASNHNLSMDDLAVFVDDIQREVEWLYTSNETIAFIKLESGAERIGIAGSLVI